MAHVLMAWIGRTDLKARTSDANGIGPIAQAVTVREYDHVVLLNNDLEEEAKAYVAWLKKKTKAPVTMRQTPPLSSPTDYTEIYQVVIEAVATTLDQFGPKTKLTFHLSPGTPAMASIWIIVAKTRFEANLIESSKEKGVADVNVPFDLSADFIPAAVERANNDLNRLSEGVRPQNPKFGDIVYESDAMRRLVWRARQAAAFSAPVLIEGESGTGKELLAAAIHAESARGNKRMVTVNCGAIPKDLVESHFFGHVKGAYTGALTSEAGYFEQADGSTLFLDEIGELPLDAQVKLLRVLQEKKVQRIRGKQEVPVDVRVIAATNRNLLAEVRAGRFREDLYFRLAILVLRAPPLRERDSDVSKLIEHVLAKLNSQNGNAQKTLTAKAKNLLKRHPWPGNVRELEATLLRAVVWSKGTVIDDESIREALVETPGGAKSQILDRSLGDGFDIHAVLAEVVRHYLARAYEQAGGNLTKATELVGLSNYQTFKSWAEKHGVKL